MATPTAQDIFIAAFRDRTSSATELGVPYWRGALDALESLELIKDTEHFFKPCPYDDRTKAVIWEIGVTEGKRLWRINQQE